MGAMPVAEGRDGAFVSAEEGERAEWEDSEEVSE